MGRDIDKSNKVDDVVRSCCRAAGCEAEVPAVMP